MEAVTHGEFQLQLQEQVLQDIEVICTSAIKTFGQSFKFILAEALCEVVRDKCSAASKLSINTTLNSVSY